MGFLVFASSSFSFAEDRIDFEKQILPIFEQKCFECHSGGGKKKPKAGLRLDVAEAIIKGTKREKIIEPHRPDDSILIEVISLPADDDDLMPPPGKAKPLSKAEVSLLRRWISEGAGFSGWLSVVQGKNPPPPKSEGVVRERIPRISELYPKLVPAKKLKAAVAQVDALIDKKLKAEGLKPFPTISDEVFLRRIYLDIAGRIPTPAEAEAFLDGRGRNRRSHLIDKLLDSEAFVSHFYNFWADIFRVRFNGRTTSMTEVFARWIKSSIRENKPYDKFVHEMLSATGNGLDNPAVGYWYRDLNMKVDSLAYTAQIFLGTQMDCAMCHDHPFDQWSQYDFFQMAAYIWDNKMQGYVPRWVSKKTFLENSLRLRRSSKSEVDGKIVVTWKEVPVNERSAERKRAQLKARYSDLSMDEIRRTDRTSYDTGIYQNYMRFSARERRDIVKERTEKGLYDSKAAASIDSSAARMMEDVAYLLGYSLRRGEKAWSVLPDTYRYGNARPGDKVLPKTPFGQSPEIDEKNLPHEVFANWMTSKKNPMFSRVIANRLFEHVFGQGIYRTRDDIKVSDEASNPELMALLEKRIMADNFDMKKFLRVLYNTRAYQRQAWAPAPSEKDKSRPGWPYHYPGPLLKRMSAEQIWDSLMTMIVPEIDFRKRNFRYRDKERFKDVDKLPPAELYEFCRDILREETAAAEKIKR
ncbi:MAG: PSD1 and planctomycete cytochrome C domain-containing protein, partial [Planctomycetes bacterium]|nr:PSD1 and planctomycete cytochrome C domain-containing protein [Planctomycetota bacterium]